ncbi:MAG: hypothetical protein HYT28_02335 [Parcubacteria group bacterium]|nr:hypothetical protein [Parcubacteria group bacterium]
MALSINPITHVISIPQADLTLVSGTLYEHDTNAFRLELKSWEDSADGMVQPKTHIHNTQVTLGGLTLARVIEIIAPYTITYEDGQYAVNLIGSNNNIADKLNLNQVSVRSNNSAGMVTITSGSGLSQEEHDQLMKALTVAKFLGLK